MSSSRALVRVLLCYGALEIVSVIIIIINSVCPTSRSTSQRGLWLSGSIHEEAHLGLSYCIQSVFKGVETGSPNYPLVIFHLLTTLLKKNTSDSPECTSFYLILACDLLAPCDYYPVLAQRSRHVSSTL